MKDASPVENILQAIEAGILEHDRYKQMIDIEPKYYIRKHLSDLVNKRFMEVFDEGATINEVTVYRLWRKLLEL